MLRGLGLCGKKVVVVCVCVFYGWEENVCKWGENSKAFLESVTASCGSHWWAQQGWEVCADVRSYFVAASIPAKCSLSRVAQSEVHRLWSQLNQEESRGCIQERRLLGENCGVFLSQLRHRQSITNPDFQEKVCTWWSLVTRCPYPIAISSTDWVSVARGEKPPGRWIAMRTLASGSPFWGRQFFEKHTLDIAIFIFIYLFLRH